MREGEGGEEASDKNKRGGLFQASTDGSKVDVGEQEEAGGRELEAGGEKHEKGEEEGGSGHRRKVYGKLGAVFGDRRPWREGNLLKTLHIDRLKKSFSKGDSDSEGTESPDKSPETGRSREEKLPKLFRAQNMSLLSRGGTEEEEEDRSGDSDGKTEIGAEEGGATIVTRKTWRGRKTRRARRITRGRKIRDQTEKENRMWGGESTETVAGSSESAGGGECGQGQAVFQKEG